jgi:NADH dehydrogenase
MYLDKTLARRADIEVTLISRENFILFTPMLHEIAAGELFAGDSVNPFVAFFITSGLSKRRCGVSI